MSSSDAAPRGVMGVMLKGGVGSFAGAGSERSWMRSLTPSRPSATRNNSASASAQPSPRRYFIEPAFSVGVRKHGRGKVLFSWSSDATFLASTGVSKVVHIYSHESDAYTLHRQVSWTAPLACRRNFPAILPTPSYTPPDSACCGHACKHR